MIEVPTFQGIRTMYSSMSLVTASQKWLMTIPKQKYWILLYSVAPPRFSTDLFIAIPSKEESFRGDRRRTQYFYSAKVSLRRRGLTRLFYLP